MYVHEPHNLEHSATGYSIGFPAESRSPGLLAVGAAKHSTTSIIQTYSSQGPTNDWRTKPEIVGADCGQAVHIEEVNPGTSVLNSNADCWFWGTSQAAPHVAGLAALIKDRYDPNGKYGPTDLANWLKETAAQRIYSPDPNNTWGHGFALLPNPAPTASLSPAPSSIAINDSRTFTVNANSAVSGVRVAVNGPGDTGNLSLTSSCPGGEETDTTRYNGGSVTLKACSAGTATVSLYKTGTNILLRVYTVTVTVPLER